MTDGNHKQDFHTARKEADEKRDKLLVPGFYQHFTRAFAFFDGHEPMAKLMQKAGTDTIIEDMHGDMRLIEEKIVNWPGYVYDDFCFETHSCTREGHESHGWMFTSRADALLYAFTTGDGGLDVHIMDMIPLRAWFWPRVEEFRTFGPLNTFNATCGYKVPIARVHKEVGARRLLIDPAGLLIT